MEKKMSTFTSPVLFVHTGKPKTRYSSLSKRNDGNHHVNDMEKLQEDKEEEEEESDLERDVMLISKLTSTPYVVSATDVKVQGSDTTIFFHHGCINSGLLVRTLGEKAWNELWRNGSFWLLSCCLPTASVTAQSDDLRRDVFGYSLQESDTEHLLGYLVHRLFDASLTLNVAILQWTEGENEDCRQNFEEHGGEFNDGKMLIHFVQSTLGKTNKESPFHFTLLSMSFADPTSKRTCEIVLALVSAHISEMSSLTSSSLVAVRSLFANISFMKMRRTREESIDEIIQKDLKSWAAPVFPPDLISFLFTRIYRWRNEYQLDRANPVLPQVVYTLLEVPPVEMETDTIAVIRYVSFWSLLGSLVINDDDEDNEGDVDRSNGLDDLFNLPSHSYKERDDPGTSDKRMNNDPLTSAFQDAKNQFLRLFVDSAVASLLLQPSPYATTMPSSASLRWSTKAVAVLEEKHKRECATRQVGLQRKLRGLISSSAAAAGGTRKSRQVMEAEVSSALEHYAEETRALEWCQRMESRYCTLALAPLLSPPIVSENTLDAVSSKNRNTDTLKETAQVNGESVVASKRATIQSVFQGGVLHGIMGPSKPLWRLTEVETLRRLLIKFAAAQSMESLLASSLFVSHKWHVQFVQEHTREVEEALHCLDATKKCLEHVQVFTKESLAGGLDRMFEAVQQKIECFASAAPFIFDSNRLELNEISDAHRMDSVPNTMPAVVHKETQTQTTESELIQEMEGSPERTVSHVPHDSAHNALEASDAPALHSLSHSSQLIENCEPARLDDEISLTAPLSDIPNDAPLMCASEVYPNPPTVTVSDTSLSCSLDEVLDSPSLESAPQRPLEEEAHSEASRAESAEKSLSFICQPHRLCRASAASALSPDYQQLLSTGSGSPAMAAHRRKAGRRLPALSFADIAREREHWRGAGDLDDYRAMLAYRLYLVGPAGCGMSSLAHCLAHAPPKMARAPAVEPHTMCTRHCAVRMLDVNLQRNVLPLGGWDPREVDLQQLADPAWASESELCRVGVDIVEVPTPMLYASSTGHVKLPARAAVYCVLYRAQDEWETIVTGIWKYVRMLQPALARPSPHVVQWMDASPVDVPLPILLIGTHSDTLAAMDSATDSECVAQQRLHQLDVWFEEQIWREAGTTEAAGWPQPLLLGSYMTSAAHWTVVGRKAGDVKSFRALLNSTLQFMHLTAPLSPPHLLARWLPPHLRALIDKEEYKNGGKDQSLKEDILQSNTLEGFWHTFCGTRKLKSKEKLHKKDREMQYTQELSDDHDKQRILHQWMRRNTTGLLVLFTALQRLRCYACCSFDEQSMDNSVLYHLGFVTPDDPDEPMGSASHTENAPTSETHSLLCMRDIVVEALMDECRLRGVLLFLPILSYATPQASRMVTIGPQWVESLWAQTLAPRMVAYHVAARRAPDTTHQSDALVAVLRQCEKQLCIALPAAYFTALRTPVPSEIQIGSEEEMKLLFMQYFAEGHVSLPILQLLWRSPYGVLALQETNASMALAACGLLSLADNSKHSMETHTALSLASGLSSPALRCEESFTV